MLGGSGFVGPAVVLEGLARGYSVTLNARNEVVRDAASVATGERIVTRLAKGEIESRVLKKD